MLKFSAWLIPALYIAWRLSQLRLYLTCFLFILLHELAHGAVVLWRRGSIRQLRLSPLGAQLIVKEPLPRQMPLFLLHLAGPLCNGLLALLFAFLFSVNRAPVFAFFCTVNCCLTIFNLLPLYPLDGGKLLLLLLARVWGYGRSFRILYFFSCIFSLFLFFLGIYLVQYNSVNSFLCLMALQCFLQARNNRRYMLFCMEKDRGRKRDSPRLRRLSLCRDDELALRLLERVPLGQRRDFSVVDRNGRLLGLLLEDDLWSGLYGQGYDASVRQLLSHRNTHQRNGE